MIAVRAPGGARQPLASLVKVAMMLGVAAIVLLVPNGREEAVRTDVQLRHARWHEKLK